MQAHEAHAARKNLQAVHADGGKLTADERAAIGHFPNSVRKALGMPSLSTDDPAYVPEPKPGEPEKSEAAPATARAAKPAKRK